MKPYLKVPGIHREESKESVVEHEVAIVGSKESARRRALFDSEASCSIIRRDIAERVEQLVPLRDPDNWIFETAEPGRLIESKFRVALDFRFDDSAARFSDELAEDLIACASDSPARPEPDVRDRRTGNLPSRLRPGRSLTSATGAPVICRHGCGPAGA